MGFWSSAPGSSAWKFPLEVFLRKPSGNLLQNHNDMKSGKSLSRSLTSHGLRSWNSFIQQWKIMYIRTTPSKPLQNTRQMHNFEGVGIGVPEKIFRKCHENLHKYRQLILRSEINIKPISTAQELPVNVQPMLRTKHPFDICEIFLKANWMLEQCPRELPVNVQPCCVWSTFSTCAKSS